MFEMEHHHQVALVARISLNLSVSFSIHPYDQSLLTGFLSSILCLHRAEVSKSLLVGQNWLTIACVHKRTLLMSLLFLFLAVPCMSSSRWGKLPFSCCFVRYCFQDMFKTMVRILVKLVTFVKGDPKAPFSIAGTPRCWGGRYSIPWNTPLYSWLLPYIVEC